jgi:FkbM family methyltransferase
MFGLTLLVVLGLLAAGARPAVAQTQAAAQAKSAYVLRSRPSLDGTGKVYLGREIAQIMGHLGAGWLERPSREAEEQPAKLLAALNLQPTDVVADIGAGTGYFSFRMARLLPQGRVLAVDVQPEMIDILEFLGKEYDVPNVQPILGNVKDPHLDPNSIDLALMVDAYHEFEYPQEMMQAIARALKPTGRIVLVEYRGENPLVRIKPLHKMTQRQVRKEMDAVGLHWVKTDETLPQQHIFIFGKSMSLLESEEEFEK